MRTYSQGMRQRLALAQAMLGLPDLLILDEPTNGLDPPQIREMREVMIRYAAAGRTVIVSSHLLAEVEQTCTHLVVMDRGRLVQAGPVADIIGSGDTLLVGLAADISDALMEKVEALPDVESAARADGGLLVRLAAPAHAGVPATVPAVPAAVVTESAPAAPEDPARSAVLMPPAGDRETAAASLLAELVRLDVPVASLGPHRRLEDAFLTLIGGEAG